MTNHYVATVSVGVDVVCRPICISILQSDSLSEVPLYVVGFGPDGIGYPISICIPSN